MKNNNRYARFFLVMGYLGLLLAAACGPTATIAPTPTRTPYPTWPSPTPYYSAPRDGELDAACRITISFFFSYKKGFSIDEYRKLFASQSQYLADAITPPEEALTLLEVTPASEAWLRDFPGTPMPGTIFSAEPKEYFYYVKFTGHYEANETPSRPFPASMTMHMLAYKNGRVNCEIIGYGHG